MTKVARKVALAALCTTALTGFSQTSYASGVNFDITGGGAVSFLYGTPIQDSNVVNASGISATGSTVYDPLTTAAGGGQQATTTEWIGSTAASNAVLQVSGLTPGSGYIISWTYIGNEAGNNNGFMASNTSAPIISNSATGVSTNTLGQNLNNNYDGSPQNGAVVGMGSTLYNNGVNTTSTPGFTVSDLTTGSGSVTNGGINPSPDTGAANLIFAYLTPGANGFQWDITTTPTNTIVFGYNDNGGADDNHDDFVGIATVAAGSSQGTTPLPGTLPLLGSVLGGGLLFRRFRKRGKSENAAA